jgi:hypothetical protein
MNELLTIAHQFNSTVLSLHKFCKELSEIADQQDIAIKEQPLTILATQMNISFAQMKAEIAGWEAELGIDPSHPWNSDNLTDRQKQALETFSNEIMELAVKDKSLAARAMLFIDSISNILPVQGELLRWGAIINLWSSFETLLSNLIVFCHNLYPNCLSEKVVKFSEIKGMDKKEIIAYLAEREAEEVLRLSFDDQIQYFSKPLNVKIDPIKSYQKELKEISLRRNLLVHNQGRINRTYLSNFSLEEIEKNGLLLGKSLVIDNAYLYHAIDCVYLSGMILIQQCWRHWKKDEEDLADFLLSHKCIYQSLLDERYYVVCKLAEYGESLKLKNKSIERPIIINHAIALRELNDRLKMEQLIRPHTWTTYGLKYRIAIHVLRGETKSVLTLLPQAVAEEEIHRENLIEWPLFKHIRNDPEFESLVRMLFPSETQSIAFPEIEEN